jgi:hypothetical protein
LQIEFRRGSHLLANARHTPSIHRFENRPQVLGSHAFNGTLVALWNLIFALSLTFDVRLTTKMPHQTNNRGTLSMTERQFKSFAFEDATADFVNWQRNMVTIAQFN